MNGISTLRNGCFQKQLHNTEVAEVKMATVSLLTNLNQNWAYGYNTKGIQRKGFENLINFDVASRSCDE